LRTVRLRARRAIVAVAALALAAPAMAQPKTPAKPAAPAKSASPATSAKPAAPAKAAAPASASSNPASPPAPRRLPAGALVRIATEIAQGLGPVPPGALVAASPLVSDVPAPKGDELATRVAAQIAGRIGDAHAHPQTATLAAARSASGRAASLVHVQVEIAKGELRVTADLYPVVSNAWERLRNPAPGPRAHAFASAPIDAEVRTFLQPIVLEQASLHKATHEETDVLAIGCGDVDADGGLELVVASRTRVVVGKLRGGKLSVSRAKPWTKLAPRVPVPMREPLASVVVAPPSHPGEILLGTTDRSAVAVDGALAGPRPLTGIPIPGADGEACAFAAPETGAFEGPGLSCTPPTKGDPFPVLMTPVTRFDAVAAWDLVGKDGSVAQIVAAREPTGKLRLRRTDASGTTQEITLDGAGAQIAIADLDLDGTPEIVTSGDLADGDVLVVHSWKPSGLVQRLRYPTKEPVRAIATCPPEDRGLPSLVAVVGGEVWLVR